MDSAEKWKSASYTTICAYTWSSQDVGTLKFYWILSYSVMSDFRLDSILLRMIIALFELCELDVSKVEHMRLGRLL